MRKRSWVIGGAALLVLSAAFWGLLWNPIQSTVPENDLWWMIPTIGHSVLGKSFFEVSRFLISPWPPMLGQPLLKGYLFLTIPFGIETRHLILLSVLLHFGNAGMLFALSRQFGFSREVGIFSSLVYGTMFAHFHAYLWPTAAQHLLAVSTILLFLTLYLKTEELFASNSEKAKGFFRGTFAVGMIASLQRSAWISPILLLTHLGLSSKRVPEMQARYNRWLPLLMGFLIYPVIALSFVGDVRLAIGDAFIRFPAPAALKAVLLFGLAGGILWMIRGLLGTSPRAVLGRRFLGFSLLPLGVILFVGFCLKDTRQILLPYNALVPILTALTSFLDPIQTALGIDSTEGYHYLPTQVSPFHLFLLLGLLGLFATAFVAKKRELLIGAVWYGFTLVYLLGIYSSFPLRIPSRYFIYLSPLFAILFCSVVMNGIDRFSSRIGLKRWARGFLLAGIFLGLCTANLLAIRVAMFRGKLVNHFSIYDDLRAAHLIREDLLKTQKLEQMTPQSLYVSNVSPMPFKEVCSGIPPLDPSRFDNFRLVVREVFSNPSMEKIRVNPPPQDAGQENWYQIQGDRITDGKGRPIDPFTQLFEEGITQMGLHHEEALALFRRAVEIRPFFLRYLLGSCRLSDVRWITGDLDLWEWTHRIGERYARSSAVPIVKYEQALSALQREMLDYLNCLLSVSYLEYRAGHLEESRAWLSQIQFIERDPEVILTRVAQEPFVHQTPGLAAFLQRLKEPAVFQEPLPWRREDYGFGRFLMRLVFHWDIRSQWDRRFHAATV